MEVSVNIQCDLNNEVEKSFVQWLHGPQVREDPQGPQRLKDAFLIGYYITVHGIHAFYKNYFETDFKSICQTELTRLEREKEEFEKRVRYQFEQDTFIFEKRIEALRQEKDQLEQQSQETVKQTASFCEQRYQGEMQLLKIEHQSTLRELQSKFDVASNELSTMRTQERAAESQLFEQINYLKMMLQEKDERLHNAYTSEKKDRIQTLERLIEQKEAEIHTLKTCNYVKGNLGEQTIMNALREHYPRHDIKHTGKTACEGDIHMTDVTDGTLVLIESKYKQTIDKNDIDKFCRDVSAVSEKQTSTLCVGGVFVSLLTKNIPGKGDVYMDIIGGIPVLYIGFRNVEDFAAVFKRYMDMFLALTKFHMSQGVKESTLDELFNEINFYFNMIQKNKTRVEDFKKNTLTKLTKFIADVENDTKVLENRMEELLRKNNCLKYETAPASSSHVCTMCHVNFPNKRQLTMHVKQCSQTQI
jgi:hypothetical protein